MPNAPAAFLPDEPSPFRSAGVTALCFLAIAFSASAAILLGGIQGDAGNFPWIGTGFCALLGSFAFIIALIRLERGPSLALVLAMLANPMIRFWSAEAYLDIAFAFLLLAFLYLYQTRRGLNALPVFAVLMLSLGVGGLALAVAYAAALAWRKEWIRLGALLALLAAYSGLQMLRVAEIPEWQEYFRLHAQSGGHGAGVSMLARVWHNLRSLVLTLMPSTFFYGGYAFLHASLMKTLLGLCASCAVAFFLAIVAGRSVLLNGFIAGYFGIMLVMSPERLENRMLIPLIPLAFLGLGRFMAVARSLYFHSFRTAAFGLVFLCAFDGLVSFDAYRSEFAPHGIGAALPAHPSDQSRASGALAPMGTQAP